MSKPKPTASKAAAPAKDVLTKVKAAAITKPSQTVKQLASKEDEKNKPGRIHKPTQKLSKSVEAKNDQRPLQPNPDTTQRSRPWASTNDDIGVRTRRRFPQDHTSAPAQVKDAVPVAQNQSISSEPRKTWLGIGKTVPDHRRYARPQSCRSTRSKPTVTRVISPRKPHLKRKKDSEAPETENVEGQVGSTLIVEGQRESRAGDDQAESTPVEDDDESLQVEGEEESTPIGDDEGSIAVEDEQENTLFVHEEDSDSSSGTSVDDIDNLKATVEELSQTATVGNLIAAVTLRGLVLPNDGDSTSPYKALRSCFDDGGNLLTFNDPVRQANQFGIITKSVLFKKRDNLGSSVSVSAFLCTVAELIPQLDYFTTVALGTEEHQICRIKVAWELIVWTMTAAFTSFNNPLLCLNWSEAGIFALERLDAVAQGVLEKRINCAPHTINEDLILMRYVDVNWLEDDLLTLQRCAFIAEREVLEAGDFMRITVAQIKAHLEHAAEQRRKGREYAEAEAGKPTAVDPQDA